MIKDEIPGIGDAITDEMITEAEEEPPQPSPDRAGGHGQDRRGRRPARREGDSASSSTAVVLAMAADRRKPRTQQAIAVFPQARHP